MAKKKLPKPAEIKHFCKDCEKLKIDTSNVNWEGNPFTGHCSFDGCLKLLSDGGREINFKKNICQ